MMPLSEIFFIGIVLYLLYGFVFNFIVPIWKTTRKVKQQFRNMQDNAQDQAGPFQNATGSRPQQQDPTQKKANPNSKIGEYIDFEEIKTK